MVFSLVPLIQQARASLTRLLPLPPLNAPPTDPHKLGRWGEEYVVSLLKQEGMRVVARNWRDGRREIDVVMVDRRKRAVVFVEVKTRTQQEYSDNWDGRDIPLLERTQTDRLEGAIASYLTQHSLSLKRQGVTRYRLELIGIRVGDAPTDTGAEIERVIIEEGVVR